MEGNIKQQLSLETKIVNCYDCDLAGRIYLREGHPILRVDCSVHGEVSVLRGYYCKTKGRAQGGTR